MSMLKKLRVLLFGPDPEANSGSAAKDRLKLVLMADRSDIPTTMMEAIKSEMMQVLLKYLEIDQDTLEMQFEKNQGSIGLTLNIPIRRVKREDESPEAYAAAAAILGSQTVEPTLLPVPSGPSEDESRPDAGAEARQKLKDKAGKRGAKASEEPTEADKDKEAKAEAKAEAEAQAAEGAAAEAKSGAAD